MTEIDVKNFFERIRRQKGYRDSLEQEKKTVQSDVSAIKAIDYEKARVTGGCQSDIGKLLERAQERCNRLDKEIAKAIEELNESREQAHYLLSLCENEMQKVILIDRYLRCLQWNVISEKCHYSENQLYRIRNDACKAIAEKKHGSL